MNYTLTRGHESREHYVTQHPAIRPFEANGLLYLLLLASTYSATHPYLNWDRDHVNYPKTERHNLYHSYNQ